MQYCPHPHPSCGGHHQVCPQPEAQATRATSFPSHAPCLTQHRGLLTGLHKTQKLSTSAQPTATPPSSLSCIMPSPPSWSCHIPSRPLYTVSPKHGTVHISPCLKYLNVACHPYEKEPQPHQVIEAQGCPLLAALPHRMSSLNLHTPAPQASLQCLEWEVCSHLRAFAYAIPSSRGSALLCPLPLVNSNSFFRSLYECHFFREHFPEAPPLSSKHCAPFFCSRSHSF